MGMMGLRELLGRQVPTTSVGRDGFFDVEDSFCTPGFWSAYAARALQRGVHTGELGLSGKLKGYAHAIGIERALGEADSFPHDRRRAGQTYSPLVLLDTPELTEKATGEINGCIRGLFPEQEYAAFVASICELVGDLLDNVWSHGKSTGFSMAQRWGKDREGFFFEFAVADCGLGFLRELRRVGIPGIDGHRDAVAWCIQKGNSTKKKAVNAWAQRLPLDVMGNPMPGLGMIVETDNHHLGLGLAKLVEATERFSGRLWLASGDALLNIHPRRGRTYETIGIEWQGVAAACRFHSSQVRQAVQAETETEFQRIFTNLVREAE
jgi:hypothetical protein